MHNFSRYKIKIYKIYWDDCDDLYVGSTKKLLSNRISQHRTICKTGKKKTKIYEAMKKNGIYNLRYSIIESYEVFDKEEQLKWEQYHATKLQPNLNTYRCHNTNEDYKYYKINYRNTHKEQIRNLNKKYRENNKDKIRIYKTEWARKNRLKKKLEIKIIYKTDKDNSIFT